MATLIKLKVKPESSHGISAVEITNRFIEACLELDTSIFEPLIAEDQYFDDRDKYRFLAFLKGQFDSARALGLKKTIVRSGACELCLLGCGTYEFYGEAKMPRFTYIMEVVDGKIKNIFNCNASSGWF